MSAHQNVSASLMADVTDFFSEPSIFGAKEDGRTGEKKRVLQRPSRTLYFQRSKIHSRFPLLQKTPSLKWERGEVNPG